MGDLLHFPAKPIPDEVPEKDCRNCVNARFGVLTHCVLVGEAILDEATTARSCEAFEPEDSVGGLLTLNEEMDR